jgi:hypothetical protein
MFHDAALGLLGWLPYDVEIVLRQPAVYGARLFAAFLFEQVCTAVVDRPRRPRKFLSQNRDLRTTMDVSPARRYAGDHAGENGGAA